MFGHPGVNVPPNVGMERDQGGDSVEDQIARFREKSATIRIAKLEVRHHSFRSMPLCRVIALCLVAGPHERTLKQWLTLFSPVVYYCLIRM